MFDRSHPLLSLLFALGVLVAPVTGCTDPTDDDDSAADDDDTGADDDDTTGDDDDTTGDDDDTTGDDDDSAGDDDDSAGDDDDSAPVDGDGDGVTADLDCDDADPANFPGNTEVCDGQDNDCDSSTFADPTGEVDVDADGSLSCLDCNDADGANFPGNPEVCDGADNDCDPITFATGENADGDADGAIACLDCDDTDAANFPGNTEICDDADNDCDPTTFATGEDTDVDADASVTCLDCDDADANNFPGNTEFCDDADNDCDLTTFATGEDTDADADGAIACLDCDDADPANFPGNTELCDDANNDCDPTTFATGEDTDADADGVITCLDCDDADALNYPGNLEVCDGMDNDCNGFADSGSAGSVWTHDINGSINNSDFTKGNVFTATSSTTVLGWAMDLDVNANVDVTLTIGEGTSANGPFTIVSTVSLGAVPSGRQLHTTGTISVPLTAGNTYWFGATWIGGNATNYYGGSPSDPNWGTFAEGAWSDSGAVPSGSWSPNNPGNLTSGYAMEITTDSPSDAELVDADGDLATVCDDCDDADGANTPGGTEVCDGQDNDCDAATEAAGGEGDGDSDGSIGCVDCDDADAANFPGNTEVCDGADNDCDATTFATDEDTDADADGSVACLDCDDADAANYPGNTEVCDDADNDCDATTLATGEDTDADSDGSVTCLDCDDADPNSFPGNPELCDGADNDCDATTVFTGPDWTIGGNNTTDFNNGSHIGGTVFEALDVVTITELEARINGTSDITPFVATRSGTSGNWTVLAVGETTTGSGSSEFVSSGPISVQTVIGEQYFIGWHTDGGTDFYYRGNLNGEPSWSLAVGYAEDDGGSAPSPTLGLSFSTNDEGSAGQYNLIVHTADESDDDADGVTSCGGDCDDSDATIEPSATEVCDGVDNDCDASIDEYLLTSAGVGGMAWPAGSPVTVSQDLELSEGGMITDVNVTIDISYNYLQDLTVSITSPGGTTVELTSVNGGAGNNYSGTTFDDEASASITTGGAPFAGSWIPEEPLSGFDGEEAAGTWTLTVVDSHQLLGGTLNSWSLDVTVDSMDGDNAFCPATSCLDILNADPAAADGTYWLEGLVTGTAAYVCDMTNGGWTEVFFNDFDTVGPDAGWATGTVFSCGGDAILQGDFVNVSTLDITVDTSEFAHTEARIETEYWAIDSWDTENAWIDIDGANLWASTFTHQNFPGGDLCSNSTWPEDMTFIDQTVGHTGSTLLYSAGADLSSPGNDESFAVDDVVIWLR